MIYTSYRFHEFSTLIIIYIYTFTFVIIVMRTISAAHTTSHTPQTVYNTKGTRAHTHRELIRKWLWEPKG